VPRLNSDRPKAKPQSRHAPASDLDAALTLDEFCDGERMSRRYALDLMASGDGPAHYKVGRSYRITRAARDAWRQQQIEATAAAMREQIEAAGAAAPEPPQPETAAKKRGRKLGAA
jgi:hypothetical protein